MEVATASPLVLRHIVCKLPSNSAESLLLSLRRRRRTSTNTSSVGSSVVVGGVNSSSDSMSQGFHQGIFSFSDGFERTTTTGQDEHQHVAQQSRREKLRVQGFDPSLVQIQGGGDDEQDDEGSIYEQAAASSGAGNMLSEMFNFRAAAGPSASDLLASQMQQAGYRLPPTSARPPVPGFGDWYGGPHNNHRDHGMVFGGSTSRSTGNLGSIPTIGDDHAKQLNAESAAVMQLFSMNPLQSQLQQQRSPSSPSEASLQGLHHHHHQQQQDHHRHHHHHQGFAAAGSTFGTSHHDHHQASSSFIDTAAAAAAGMVEGQAGLSLSLSSSLHQLEMAKTHHDQEIHVRDGVLYFNPNAAAPTPASNSNNDQQQQQLQNPASMFQLHGQASQHVHMAAGYGPAAAASVGVVNVLRNSKYSRAAQELLEEFCSVGRGQFKGVGRTHHHHHHSSTTNPNPNPAASTSTTAAGPSSTNSAAKEQPPALSPADRFEQQRNKSKLLSMLDEVDRRYNHYCEQMQMVVNSFDSVMGFGAATPYTALAQKAMSRHFRCLKDAIVAQLKRTCELLGEKDTGAGSGITKGETPRLRLLDQSLRQQRAFHQMGMMEQEAWRPQRGLPERSVNILRAWLFEHFLHPYPSDADKHLLARQTGLSRNQVSNWFINARVRLWKPMVEEMYQQESKDREGEGEGEGGTSQTQRDEDASGNNQTSQSAARTLGQQQKHSLPISAAGHSQLILRGPETDAPAERFSSDHTTHPSGSGAGGTTVAAGAGDGPATSIPILPASNPLIDTAADVYHEYGPSGLGPAARMRLGTAGDVSLTLGLRHAGNAPEKSRFTIRDFGEC